MSDQEIKINLCYYDPENPNNNLDAYEDEDRPQPRTERCCCDNCFYGRDKLAMQLIEAKRERDKAMEKAERYRLEANAMMLQRDEARERYATEATEHMLSINRICNERDEAVEEGRRLTAILDLLKKEAQ